MPFPLSFSPFEYYYWADDRPQYPMTFPVELLFSGRLERAALAAALEQVLPRHPLLCATVDDAEVRPRWIASAPAPSWFDWASAEVPLAHPHGEPLDLRRETGLRVWVRAGPNSARMLLQFHHACCDGLAALQFIEELLTLYHSAATGQPHGSLPPLDPARLQGRGAFDRGGRAGAPPSAARLAWRTLRHWGPILLRRPAVLAAPRAPGGAAAAAGESIGGALPDEPLLPMDVRALTAAESQRLKAAASACGVSLNDLLLRDLFLALDHWRQRHQGSARAKLWINVPVNLRDRSDRARPATNRIGFGFVGLAARDCRRPDRALNAIQQQTARMRRQQQGLLFLEGLAFACGIRGAVPWALSGQRSFATAVLSNLGRVFGRAPLPRDQGRLVCGQATLERVAGAPPVRPLTRVAIAVTDYAEQLTFALRYDRHVLTAAEAAELLEQFLEILRSSAQAARA